ncbi:hypothetical protein [Clostridium tarantellae]|uniref:Uncharacterized protein n=1 Tax=Clostridium tarantellae TaxID=39493 RepID=A0A6I1MSQ5_9CLOT|nr:hypothetical protein [Clostridium tarantellae]MPQ45192.1 hypothetical protein [Clostridium tarantellae]
MNKNKIISLGLSISLFTGVLTTLQNTNKINVYANENHINIDLDLINNYEIEEEISIEEVLFNMNENLLEETLPNKERISYAALLKIASKIPAILKKADIVVDLKKFTNKFNSLSLKNNKTGWFIQKDRGNNTHGGSAYKLFDKKGFRKATLDKNGKILRE